MGNEFGGSELEPVSKKPFMPKLGIGIGMCP